MTVRILTSGSRLPHAVDGQDVVIDTETTGLRVVHGGDVPFMLAVAFAGKTFISPWDRGAAHWCECLHLARSVAAHHAKFDLHAMAAGGADVRALQRVRVWCTLLSEILIDEHQGRYDLDSLGRKHLGRGKVPIDRRPHELPFRECAEYAARDLELCAGLRDRQRPLIEEQGLGRVHDLEMRTCGTLFAMERRGVPVNAAGVKRAAREIGRLIADFARELHRHAGGPVNVNSGPQLLAVFRALGLPVTETANGNPSFNKAVLEAVDHPIGNAILDCRSATKIKDSFVDAIGEHVNAKTGRVHTTFNQLRDENYGSYTGRLSSTDPNLQQIPSPKRGHPELAKIVRRFFAHPDYDWLTGDWKQMDFRVFAHYSNDAPLLEMYRKNPDTDHHQATADLTGLRRNPDAKQMNLGLVFGMGEAKMARTLGLPTAREEAGGRVFERAGPEARALFTKYHAALPGVRRVLRKADALARARGYITTLYGRRLRFPAGAGTYKAAGVVFQGTAADLMKAKLNEIEDASQSIGGELILTVHDEFDVLCRAVVTEVMAKEMKDIMEDVPALRLPIRADVTAGRNWWEASK